MTYGPRPVGSMRPRAAWARLMLGLLLTPLVTGLALRWLPGVPLGVAFANLTSFAGAASVAIASLAIAATAEVSLPIALGVAAAALTAIGGATYGRITPRVALLVVDTALVCLGWALGTSLGRRVQHPGHLLPACVVAASADVVSLVSPEGPSHAIAQSDRALSVLAIWFPVPGSAAISPALGIGDLLFMGFVLGGALAHRLPYGRAVSCCVLGTALAGVAAACFGVAFPALVPIAASVIVGLPAIRRLRAADRRTARWSMLIAVAVALVSIARSAFAGR